MTVLRVAINAQLFPGSGWGGVEQFTISLVYALGRLNDGPEEYVVVGPWGRSRWLEPYLGSNQRLVAGPRPPLWPMLRMRVKAQLGPLRDPGRKLWRRARRLVFGAPRPFRPAVTVSSGFLESLGADVVHFPYQDFIQCQLPAIYNPHDLQHLHYPQFFTQEEFALREAIYQTGCRQAQAVAAESHWVKDDIIRQYSIDSTKIHVIARGSPTEFYEPRTSRIVEDVRRRFRLPQGFALYPAQTWPHKNHLRLLEAIALLRDRDGVLVNLVCTGRQTDFWPTIRRRIGELELGNQARFLGFVDSGDLRALYHLAQFVVFPSLFEGGGFPVLEAFREGTPIACSTATSLPEYGGDAILPFDPASVESIAKAVRQMGTDAELRAMLRQRGALRIRDFTWEHTAKTYRALYRSVAGRPLLEEDRDRLENAWAVADKTTRAV